MNKYGVRAKEHWTKCLPERVAQLENPEEFFTSLGEQVADRVFDISCSLEAQHAERIRDADYLTRVGILTNIQRQAEEIAMSEMVLLPPEVEEDEFPEDEEEEVAMEINRVTFSNGMPVDRDHELWRLREDDSVSVEEFRAAGLAWDREVEAAAREKVRQRRAAL